MFLLFTGVSDKWAELSGPLAECHISMGLFSTAFLSFAIKLFFFFKWDLAYELRLLELAGLHMSLLPWLLTTGVQLLTTTFDSSYPRWIWRQVFPLTAITKPAQRALVLSWWNLVFWAGCWGIPLLSGLPDELWKPSGTFGATIRDC